MEVKDLRDFRAIATLGANPRPSRQMPLFSRRRLFAGFASIGAVAAVFGLRSATARYYDGPVSDHFDGTRFFDVNGPTPRTLADQWRWYREGGRQKWPERAPSPYSDKPPARVDGPGMAHLLRGPREPAAADSGPQHPDRSGVVGARFAGELRGPETRQRSGHCVRRAAADRHRAGVALPLRSSRCRDTLSRLHAAHRPRVIAPLGNDTIIKNYDSAILTEAYDWHQHIDLDRGINMTLVPTRHWSARGLTDRNKALWASFVIETPAGRIYHVADSGYGDGHHFRAARDRYGPFRLAILPIGAYEPRWFMRDMHMNPAEAVQAFPVCGAEFALGHHYGTFQLTDEAIDAPMQALEAARVDAGIEPERFRVLKPGQFWDVEARATA